MSLTSPSRRCWIETLLGAGASRALSAQQQPSPLADDLPLVKFEPKSTLRVAETIVPRSRYPLIDFHTHVTLPQATFENDRLTFTAQPAELLPTMDKKNIRIMVNLTGGQGNGLLETIRVLQTPHPDRFIVFTEPTWQKAASPGYAKLQAEQIETAHRAGARGLKILKTLGLYLRENITEGKLVKVDDPRFDPMWEAAGSYKMPVAIHTSDPVAFFLPIDRFNERWEELHNHPDWSFYGKDFPTNRELQEARRRVMRRHPRTHFVCLHCAESEDLAYVSECLDSHPNMYVDIAARIGELGRQPRASRKFFDKYQDRIVFGTDAVPKALNFPQQVFEASLYEIYYRFLETEDEYFDYSTARVPPQGRWRISGIGLSDNVLHKLYWQNAARLLGLP